MINWNFFSKNKEEQEEQEEQLNTIKIAVKNGEPHISVYLYNIEEQDLIALGKVLADLNGGNFENYMGSILMSLGNEHPEISEHISFLFKSWAYHKDIVKTDNDDTPLVQPSDFQRYSK